MSYIKKKPFLMLCHSNENTAKTIWAWWRMFNAFVKTCAVAFRTKHGQNKTRKCDTEGFIPVKSLNSVVGSPYSFIKPLIDSTRKIWSSIYINAKLIQASKKCACTISECVIVCNVLHVTSTCLFISWCSGASNIRRTLWVWHYSWNSVEENCVPASSEIISNSHQPNLSISQI